MTSRLREHGYDSPIVEVAFALASHRGSIWRVSGTAVAIAPQLLLTAKHVLDDHWNAFEGGPVPRQGNGTFLLYARHYHSSPNVGIIWTVRQIWIHQGSDLALLRVESGAPECRGYVWKTPALQIIPPKTGDKIAAFGYRESTWSVERSDDSTPLVTWNEKPTTSTGTVTEVYADRRDSVMLTFPSFQTNARFEPGMSGGPIFSESGELVGIVCTGLTTSDSNDQISTATSLWPLMGLSIQTRLQGESEERDYLVHELADRGIITVKNLDRVSIERDGDKIHTILKAS